MNPVAHASGLKLNITEADNAMDLELARSVADYFRVSVDEAEEIISNQIQVVSQWRTIAESRQSLQENSGRWKLPFVSPCVHEYQLDQP